MTFVKTIESYRQGARTLPGRYYTTPEVFAEERERIFARHWICVGRDATLAAPGEPDHDELRERLAIYRDVMRTRGFWAFPGIQR